MGKKRERSKALVSQKAEVKPEFEHNWKLWLHAGREHVLYKTCYTKWPNNILIPKRESCSFQIAVAVVWITLLKGGLQPVIILGSQTVRR